MIEAKLQLLSILSNHTADRNIDDGSVSASAREAREKALHTSEYTEMFYLVANDIMNTLYSTEEDFDSTGDAIDNFEAACEDAGVNFVEVKKHGVTYLNLLHQSGKTESDVHIKLSEMLLGIPSLASIVE